MRRRSFIAYVAAVLLYLSGCGGGSTGTDGGVSLQLAGTIRDPAGAPLEGVSVIILENGDEAMTDLNGNYAITTTVSGETVDLIVSKDGKEARTSFEAPEQRPSEKLQVDLTLDEASFDVSVASVTVVQDDPSPRPTNEPESQSYTIFGTLETISGRPVRGFTVGVGGTSAVTDAEGGFRLRTKDRNPVLMVSNRRHRVRVPLGTIDESAREVRVSLVLILASAEGNGPAAQAATFGVKLRGKTARGRN